ncbi:MAG: Nramp family divalent metal transporter [Flavobacteriales bacterium]|nr:Nramp family divalent metal transporter [Flavobacteriales bacterium]
MTDSKRSNFLKTLGPGILFASTAIGVSHLVQSTQAGAYYGLGLVWAVLLANVLKYPFFEYGSRYANATGKSIIDGYLSMGKIYLWIYFIITLGSMFFVSAAVGKVTVGFMQNLFGLESSFLTMIILFSVCGIILISGQYKTLDGLMKVIGIVLVLSTIIAFVMTLAHGKSTDRSLFEADWFPTSDSGTVFLIALMGWMPTAVDLSAWNSLWTVERIKQTGYKPSLKETLTDFRIGYWASAALSICFVVLGAFLMFGTEQTFSPQMGAFANEIIGLYTSSIGQWSYLIIAAAAFSIMFGTCIAVFDGYGRALTKTTELLFTPINKQLTDNSKIKRYQIGVGITVAGALMTIVLFENNADGFKSLVNFAQSLSFLIAPYIAIVNFRLVSRSRVGENAPGLVMQAISYLGIIFLTSFSLYYLYKVIL